MKRIKTGDLVSMKTHDTGLVGIVLEREPPSGKSDGYITAQIGIKWLLCPGRPLSAGPIQWEPEAWLEVVSESR